MEKSIISQLFLLFLGLGSLGMVSCQQEQKQTAPAPIEGSANEEIETSTYLTIPYLSAFDESGDAMTMHANPEFDVKYLEIDSLIKALELTYPEIPLKVLEQNQDTLRLEIINANFLSQQMGSAGARSYLAEATYAFTEIPGIKTVVFVFEEGDHARPGAYTRESVSKSGRIE